MELSRFAIGLIWFLIGLFIGANFWFFIYALCAAAKRGDRHLEEK
jgi:hypothetical protein